MSPAAALELDDAETAYRQGCRALVQATRDEVAATGPRRVALTLVVDSLSAEVERRWQRVLALAPPPVGGLPIPYRLATPPAPR